MKYSPTPQNKKNDVASVVLFLTAVMLFFFGSQYYVKYRAAAQALGVVCLAASVFFLLKRMTVFVYTVYPKDRDTKKSVSELTPEELTFIISRRFGTGAEANKAALDLEALTTVTDLPASVREKKKIIKEFGKTSLYYYTVTFMPLHSTLLIFEKKGSDRIGIVIEPDGDFKGFFEKVARLNKDKTKE